MRKQKRRAKKSRRKKPAGTGLAVVLVLQIINLLLDIISKLINRWND